MRRQSHLRLVGTEQTPAEPSVAADSDQARAYIDGVLRMAEEIRIVPFEDVFTVDEEPVTLEIAKVGILRKVSDEYPLAQAAISATDLERPIAFDIDSSTVSHIVGDSVRWIRIETLRGRQYALSDGFDSESRQLVSWAARAVSGGWSPRAVEFSMTSAGLEAIT